MHWRGNIIINKKILNISFIKNLYKCTNMKNGDKITNKGTVSYTKMAQFSACNKKYESFLKKICHYLYINNITYQ